MIYPASPSGPKEASVAGKILDFTRLYPADGDCQNDLFGLQYHVLSASRFPHRKVPT
jgi:hypothetical protein